MKIFIVNVRNCLTLSQYEPFFYEHMYKGNLLLLDELADTNQLDITREQLIAYVNQHPFSFKEAAVFIFIPRDFAMPLSPRDYELYNDMNTYMHLVRCLPENFRFYNFYIDKTDELERNDAIYKRLDKVNSSLRTDDPELEDYFLRLPQIPAQGGDFKEFLCSVTAQMGAGARSFYELMLDHVADVQGDGVMFQNALNNYIGETRKALDKIKHVYAQAYRDDVSRDIRAKLEVVYYLKKLAAERPTLATFPAFEDFNLSEQDYKQIRHTLATYRKRLQTRSNDMTPASKTATCPVKQFQMKSDTAPFRNQIKQLVDGELARLGTSGGSENLVDSVFAKLGELVRRAQELLDAFGKEQSKALVDPKSYSEFAEPERFDCSEDLSEEERQEEAKLLQEMNANMGAESVIPGFAAENRLEQTLEQINARVNEILEKKRAYNFGAFFVTLLVSLLFVGALYLGAQISVFVKEHSLWIFLLYLLVAGGSFLLGYVTCNVNYNRQISQLLEECKNQVKDYLSGFQNMADLFVSNVQKAGEYYCLKTKLEAKRDAREKYRLSMQKYAWHKEKIGQILKNLKFFDPFVQNAAPLEENPVALEAYDQDPVHTKFYHLKVFN